MASIIKNSFRQLNSSTVIGHYLEDDSNRMYIGIGHPQQWDDEEVPDAPIDSDAEETNIVNNLMAIKKINSIDFINVCKRIDWVAGNVYNQYDSSINMIDSLSVNFYVLTDENNVYKCLDNNLEAQSLIKPIGTSLNTFTTSDGYVWKFMYNIKTSDTVKYLTTDWMPVYRPQTNDGTTQWQVQDSAVPGAIDLIKVLNGGSGYSLGNPPTVTITGNGINASGTPIIDGNGSITGVDIVNSGQDYTTATVDFVGGAGSGATATAVLGPRQGHGSDAKKELGGFFLMFKTEFNDVEGGDFPIDVTFRQISLISNPVTNIDGNLLVLDNIVGNINIGDSFIGADSNAVGVVVSHNLYEKTVHINMTSGQYLVNELIEAQHDNTINAVILSNNSVKLPVTDITESGDNLGVGGDILYVNNRTAILRTSLSSEQIRGVLSF